MKIFGGLKLHPNGFLGAPIEYRSTHVDRPVRVDLIGAVSRKVSFESDDNVLKPNNLIEELFDELTKKEDAMKYNPLFRERVYMAALQAFGTLTINEWIERQKQNPYFDTMQNRFVEETVCYVYTGFRKYHAMVYVDTLDIGTHNAFQIGPYVREHLMLNTAGKAVLVREFIQKWLTQRDGMSDLIFSLRVLFGS